MTISSAELRKLRRRRRWTQRLLAEHLDVDPMTVSRWERGLSRPRRAVSNRLAALLAQAPTTAEQSHEPSPRPPVSASERVDELVRIVGLDPALRALRRLALLERKPMPARFVDDPTKRMREVEAALQEQSDLIARAKIR